MKSRFIFGLLILSLLCNAVIDINFRYLKKFAAMYISRE